MSMNAVYDHALRGFLQPVNAYLDDASVTEVLINAPQEIYVERGGRLMRVSERFDSIDPILSAITVIAQWMGRAVDHRSPILEGRLPDGSRVEAVVAPAARSGACLAIRRFSSCPLTVRDLLESGALSVDAAQALRLVVQHGQNVIVSGGTGSGKTSLLNVLSSFIADDERVVVIEDASELRLQGSHVVQLEAQPADAKGRGRVTVGDLFRASLRLRPDRIVVGEIRGGEAVDLVQAMSSGHGGCMSTLHASHPIDALHRLETMALMASTRLPFDALRAQIAAAVDVVVQVARTRDGVRRVTHVSEVTASETIAGAVGYELAPLFALQAAAGEAPSLTATGVTPRCAHAVHARGQRFPDAMYGGRP